MQAGFQGDLFERSPPAFGASFERVERTWLDDRSWIDLAPGFVRGSDRLFEAVLSSRRFGPHDRWMYERRVEEPRLTDRWRLAEGTPLEPSLLEDLRQALGRRHGVVFDSVGFNLYRGGHDSVAWHGDRIVKEIAEPVVALVSLGEPRRFLLRPRGGGRSIALKLGRGDLLVTGGRTQRDWEHSVPKVARAGPRISIAFRHGLHPGAYGRSASPSTR